MLAMTDRASITRDRRKAASTNAESDAREGSSGAAESPTYSIGEAGRIAALGQVAGNRAAARALAAQRLPALHLPAQRLPTY